MGILSGRLLDLAKKWEQENEQPPLARRWSGENRIAEFWVAWDEVEKLKANATTASSDAVPTSCATSAHQQTPSGGASSSPRVGEPSGGSGTETKIAQTSPATDLFEDKEEEKWWNL